MEHVIMLVPQWQNINGNPLYKVFYTLHKVIKHAKHSQEQEEAFLEQEDKKGIKYSGKFYESI